MNMKAILLTTTAVLTLSTATFAAEKESYESNTNVEVDSKGNTTRTMTTKSVSDPKGLGNKHVVSTKETEKKEGDKTTSTYTKTVDGKSPQGATDKYKNTSTVQKDGKGNYVGKNVITKTDDKGTTTQFEKNATVDIHDNGDTDKLTTTKTVTDPEGLFNKKTVTTSNSEKEKDEMIQSTKEVIVDGKVVEKTIETTPQN